jgi:nucleotide-binding universal stress UspA family protein
MMKTVLLLVHDDAGQEARLQAALDVTRAIEGHLKCVDVSVMPALAGNLYSTLGEALLLADECEQEAQNRVRLEARLAREGLPWDWTDCIGAIAPALEEASALADLIVVNRALEAFPLPAMRNIAGDLVVRSGKPILAVPEDARGVNVCGDVLICWDGSACSVSAMRAAVPLLRLAETVTLFEIDDDGRGSTIGAAAEYLSRHDIHARLRQCHARTRAAGDIILDAIRADRVDYVVMGGFSHLRFSEALFGGVTRTMLRHSPVPIFLAH